MKRGRDENSPSLTRLGHGVDIDIPLDLTVEILKKLPTKSLMRFQCVSKLWSSIISSQNFIDSIMTPSLSQPQRDAHLMYHSGKCFLALFSETDKELLLLPGENHLYLHQLVHGLICNWSINHDTCMSEVAIYNPTTRQSINLPELKITSNFCDFLFGYDPLKNQYKVVLLGYGTNKSSQVFTLGDPMGNQWRKIQGTDGSEGLFGSVVCINGTIYYREVTTNSENLRLIRFDVRSEKFYHVDTPKEIQMAYNYFLINYHGKLGFISCEKSLEIWVMETQGWSKIFFCEMDGFIDLRIAGATHSGEIVFVDRCSDTDLDPMLRVYYYDPKRICMRYVDLKDYYKEKGSHNIRFIVWTVSDYVENIMRLK